jgi:PAS domain S-box-containing protein
MPSSTYHSLLDERARMTELQRVLVAIGDSCTAYESVAELARATLGVSQAHVSLVSDTENIELGSAGPVVGRSSTAALHALDACVAATGKALVVDDVPVHAARLGLAAPESPGSYLGVPLFQSQKHVLGCLAIIDESPRKWTAEDQRRLQGLADLLQPGYESFARAGRTRHADWSVAWECMSRLASQLPDAVVMADSNNIVIGYNAAAEELFGYQRDEIIDTHVMDAVRAEDNERVVAEAALALWEHGIWRGTVPVVRRDGTLIEIATTWLALRDEHGETIANVSINREASAVANMSAAMLQAQKMENLGALAGALRTTLTTC